jgi:hypothetical protein
MEEHVTVVPKMPYYLEHDEAVDKAQRLATKG